MLVGVFLILSLLIIAGAILFGMYMYYCSENRMNMFTNPEHNEYFGRVMSEIKILREEIQEMKNKV